MVYGVSYCTLDSKDKIAALGLAGYLKKCCHLLSIMLSSC